MTCPHGVDGKRKCRTCRRAEHGAWMRTARGRLVGMLAQARIRAKRDRVPCTIGLGDLCIPEVCPVLGIKLSHGPAGKGAHDASPSLDRIDPALGYVPGNIAVMSKRANTIKNSGTAAEHEAIARWMRERSGS